MTRYAVVPATIEHAQELAANMRQADIEEVALLGRTPLQALTEGMDGAMVGTVNGRPLAMFGTIPYLTVLSEIGCIWLLGSKDVPKHRMAFLRFSREYVALMREQFDVLCNFADERNALAVRWLKWLGFEFPPLHHPLDRRLVYFEWRRNRV